MNPLTCAGVLVATCWVPSAVLGSQNTVFRSTADAVMVDVSVTRNGVPVTGLTAADFLLSDNGVAQAIVDVIHEALPIDVTVVADLSATAEGPSLDALRRSIDEVLRRLRPGDRASLVVFDQRIREVDISARGLQINVDSTWTASSPAVLFDAMASALIKPLDPARRRMAIVFTEGKDQGSFLDEAELIDVASTSGVPMFLVGVTDGTARAPQVPANLPLLRRLADVTGGLAVTVQRDQDLSASFVQAFEAFRSSYVLRYTPSGQSAPGWHSLAVSVPSQRGATVRARKGFLAK
jgi:VWFA-related protein